MKDTLQKMLSESGIPEAHIEAEKILSHVARSGGDALDLARKRAGGAPLAYVLGVQTFMGLELLTAPGALVPREETELLGESALHLLRAQLAQQGSLTLVDMCCGSGNLGCALTAHLGQGVKTWCADLTEGCVSLAKRNVHHLGLEGRVEVCQGDLFGALQDKGLEGKVDLIVCNPPYISTGRLGKDRADLLVHEPVEAFDGGPYGLTIHQRVLKEVLPFLKPGGWLLFEFGLGQDRQMEILFQRARIFEEVKFFQNAEGAPRVIQGRRKIS